MVWDITLGLSYWRARVTQYSNRVMGWMTRMQFPAGTEILSIHHHIHTCSGAHPAFCWIGTATSLPEGEMAVCFNETDLTVRVLLHWRRKRDMTRDQMVAFQNMPKTALKTLIFQSLSFCYHGVSLVLKQVPLHNKNIFTDITRAPHTQNFVQVLSSLFS